MRVPFAENRFRLPFASAAAEQRGTLAETPGGGAAVSEPTKILRPARPASGPAADLREALVESRRFVLPADPRGSPQVEIPSDRKGDWPARAVLARDGAGVAEQFRHLAVRVRARLAEDGRRTLAVTSATRSDGKTTVVCNFALAMASIASADRVALLELDLRRPRVADGLRVKPEVGIESVLAGDAPLESARLRTQFDSLDLFLARGPARNALELLSGPDVLSLFEALASSYRFVVVDTPPVLLVPDSPLLVPNLDACLFIVRRGRTRLAALANALDMLPEDKLLGVFINQIAAPVRSREYGYYAKS